MRLVAMATVKTAGAREVQAVWPCGWAWLWPFQGLCQPCGSRADQRAAGCLASVQRARERGDSALTGTKQWAREGSPGEVSVARPPPGTMAWRWGGNWRGLPQVCRRPGKPGQWVPMQCSSCARRVRAVDDALHRAWEARR